tara:strand:+ start:378 stop:629 length:252 start_codon:yes stop_codon:yes gene_type:complete
MMLTVDEYMALRQLISSERESEGSVLQENTASKTPKKRRKSAYSRKYSAAFKKISTRYKNKNGTWRKGGFKAAVKAAHKAVKK